MKRKITVSISFLLLFTIAGLVFVATFYSPASPDPQPHTLHTAAIHWPEQIEGIVAGGASLDGVNESGLTPLQAAVTHRSQSGVARLLSLGADPNIGNRDGKSPLAQAAMWGDLQTVRLLISAGADVNAEYQSRPVLHHAVVHGHSEIVDLLLKQPSIDVNRRATGTGWTPLHLAVQHNRDTLVKMLLENQADIGIQDHAGNTPYDLAKHKLDGAIAPLLMNLLQP